MVRILGALVMLLLGSSATGSATEANPIRKVVTLMQDMQKEIEGEGEKEKELFDKFMCYCESTTTSLNGGISAAEGKISDFSAKLEEDTATKQSTDQELAQHKADRSAAQKDQDQATSIREKEEEEYSERAATLNADIAAMSSAIPALEKGMGAGALLQMPNADRLRRVVEGSSDAFDRQTVLAFLDQSSNDYVPQSGQIAGILKQMEEDMTKSLDEATADEKSAAAGYAELKSAKVQEVQVASQAIETKMKLAGELAVSVVQNQDALDDANAELADNQKFLAELKKQCADKQTEWGARKVARAQEVQAISEAIGILNDDDALDIFKKAIPTALLSGVGPTRVGFLQAHLKNNARFAKAHALIASSASIYKNSQLALLSYQMASLSKAGAKGGTQQFDVVMKMIDRMTGILEKEQAGDEEHKGYCEAEFAKSAKDQEANKAATAAVSASISDLNDQIDAIAGDISTITAEITALDLSVASATIQRKNEHAEYTESSALNEAASSLIEKARQRLYKFYNPVLYKAPPKKELSMEDKIYANAGRSEFTSPGFVQVKAHRASRVAAPPPPPATFGAYEKKGEKSTGVLALMDGLVKDLAGEMAEAAQDEKSAQADYEALMADSAATRAQDAKSITDKEKAKATLETKLQADKESKALSVEEAEQITTVIYDLHGSCDFLLENFDMRKEARTNELESLKNSKSVLSGANFAGL